jgi:hypothetical protein
VQHILNADVGVFDVQVDFEALGEHLDLIDPDGLEGGGGNDAFRVTTAVGVEVGGGEKAEERDEVALHDREKRAA